MKKQKTRKRKFHIKKGDMVYVLSGNYKGATGRVLKVFPKKERAIVEGVNFVYKHKKPTQQGQSSNIVKMEAPIHISNLLPICPETGKPTRVGRMRVDENGNEVDINSFKSGKLVRYSKRALKETGKKVEIK